MTTPESPVVLFAALPLLVCGVSLVMVGAMNMVVYEKQNKLLGAMRMMVRAVLDCFCSGCGIQRSDGWMGG